jgi:hypothetical protein
MILNELLFGMTISLSLLPIWYIIVEIIDKFYRAFIVSNRKEGN